MNYKKERMKILRAVRKIGLYLNKEDLEDVVHDVMEYRLKKPNSKQLYKHSVIDCIRKDLGRKNEKYFDDRINLRKPLFLEDLGPYLIDESHKTIIDVYEFCGHLKGAQRSVFLLYYKWGMTIGEIGFVFEKSEAWVSITLKKITESIKEFRSKELFNLQDSES